LYIRTYDKSVFEAGDSWLRSESPSPIPVLSKTDPQKTFIKFCHSVIYKMLSVEMYLPPERMKGRRRSEEPSPAGQDEPTKGNLK